MNADPVRLTRAYVWIVGAGLLLDGAALLVLDGIGVNASDTLQNVLHVLVGMALLVVSFLSRHGHAPRAVWASIVFGTFYIALGILGITISGPFDAGEDAFHFTLGLVAVLLGAWALKPLSSPPVPPRNVARPVEVRSVPVTRRRARHRPGKARARSHRH